MTTHSKTELASPLPEARRIHDEKVYLAEDRSAEPKQIFRRVKEILTTWNGYTRSQVELLDVGSATGEFVGFLSNELPTWRLAGVDVSESLNSVARQRVPSAQFHNASLLDRDFFQKSQFDVITCMGVLSIFDSLEEPLENLMLALRPNGLLLIFGMMNEYAMDVLVRCRYADAPSQPWQIGYNAFSREYYERVLRDLERKQSRPLKCHWEKFHLKTSLPRRADLLRNWTIKTEDDPYQQIRGTSQLSTQFILRVE